MCLVYISYVEVVFIGNNYLPNLEFIPIVLQALNSIYFRPGFRRAVSVLVYVIMQTLYADTYLQTLVFLHRCLYTKRSLWW